MVAEFSDGRVLVVLPSDPRNHLKKVRGWGGVTLPFDMYSIYMYMYMIVQYPGFYLVGVAGGKLLPQISTFSPKTL